MLSLLLFGSSLCLAGRNLHHSFGNFVSQCLIMPQSKRPTCTCKGCSGSKGQRGKAHEGQCSSNQHSDPSTDRIARIVRRIIYVCVVTVDGSDSISGATEIAPDITNITFFHRMENTAYSSISILRQSFISN